MQNIVIEFVADSEGLKPGVEQLQNLGKIDKELASTFNTTNAAIKKQQESLSSTSSSVKTFVDNLKQVDKATAGAFGTAALENFSKKGIEGAKQLAKNITDVEKTLKQLEAASKRSLNPELVDKYKKSIEQGRAKLMELYQALDEIQAQGNVFDEFGQQQEETSEKTQTFKARLRELKNELQQLEANGQDGTEAFRQMSIEAAKLEDQIGDTNQQIKILASDTFKADVLIDGIQGVTAAFGVAQSASALFGAESEDLQETLVKINAVMALSNGIQQLNNFLKGESAAKEAVKIALQKISILNTKLETAATSESIIVRNAATAAQWLLNAAMAANPGLLLLSVIAGIAGALMIFSSNAETASEAQAKLNAEWEAAQDALDAYEKELNSEIEERIKARKNELTLLQSQGASEQALLKKKQEIAAEELRLAGNRSGFKKQEIDDIKNTQHEITKLKDQIKELEKEKNISDENSFIDRWFFGERSKDAVEENIKEIQEKLKPLEKTLDDAQKRQDDLAEKSTAKNALELEKQKKDKENFYKNEVGFAQALVAAQIEGTKQRLQAEIQLNEKLKQQKLQDVNLNPGERLAIIEEAAAKERSLKNSIRKLELEDEKSIIQERLNLAERGSEEELAIKKELISKQLQIDLNAQGLSDQRRREINSKAKADQQQLDKEIALLKLANQESLNNAALAKAQAGTNAEYNLRLNALNIQLKREIISAGNNAAKKIEIEENYWKKVRELGIEYNFKIVQDTINTRISSINSQIAPLELEANASTNDKLLALRKGLIDNQTLLEVESINKRAALGEIGEKMRSALVWEVLQKSSANQKKLERDTANAIAENKRSLADAEVELEIQKNEQIINSVKSTERQKVRAQLNVYVEQRKLIDNEKTLLEKQRLNGIVSEEQYQIRLLQIKKKYKQLDFDEEQFNENRKNDLRQQIAQTIMQLGQEISDTLFSIDKQRRDQELELQLSRLNEQRDRELAAKNLTETQKKEIDERYKAKERKIRQEAAKKDREAQINQAIINGALAITNILATMPKFDFGIAQGIAIAAAIATTAIQVAKIKSTPLPGLYRGTKKAKAGFYRLGELGAELMYEKQSGFKLFGKRREEVAYVPEGARVFNANETSQLLAQMKKHEWPTSIMQSPLFNNIPTFSKLPLWAEKQLSMQMSGKGNNIDYEQLGDVIANKIGREIGKFSDLDIPGTNVHIDENGIAIISQKRNQRIVYNNKRYSTK